MKTGRVLEFGFWTRKKYAYKLSPGALGGRSCPIGTRPAAMCKYMRVRIDAIELKLGSEGLTVCVNTIVSVFTYVVTLHSVYKVVHKSCEGNFVMEG